VGRVRLHLCVRSERERVLLDHFMPQHLRLRLPTHSRRVRSYAPSRSARAVAQDSVPSANACWWPSSFVMPRAAQLTTASNQAYVNSTGATATFSGNRFYLAYGNNGVATMYPYMTFDWRVRHYAARTRPACTFR